MIATAPPIPVVAQALPPAAPAAPVAPLHDAPIGGARPSVDQTYTGSMPFLGHAMPLPDGTWTVLVRQGTRYRNAPRTDHVALVRHDGAMLIAILDIFGNPVTKAKKNGFPVSATCTAKATLVSDVRAATPRADQDCMTVDVRRTAAWREPGATLFLRNVVARLDSMKLALPPRMARVQIVEADRQHALVEAAWFNPQADGIPPDPDGARGRNDWTSASLAKDPNRAAYLARVRGWGQAWRQVVSDVLHKRQPTPALREVALP